MNDYIITDGPLASFEPTIVGFYVSSYVILSAKADKPTIFLLTAGSVIQLESCEVGGSKFELGQHFQQDWTLAMSNF